MAIMQSAIRDVIYPSDEGNPCRHIVVALDGSEQAERS